MLKRRYVASLGFKARSEVSGRRDSGRVRQTIDGASHLREPCGERLDALIDAGTGQFEFAVGGAARLAGNPALLLR